MKQVITYGVNAACREQMTIIDGVVIERSTSCSLPPVSSEWSYCYECGGDILVFLEDQLVTKGNPLGLVVKCELCGWSEE